MTIDEGIQLCEYNAKTNEILMKRYDDASGYTRSGNAEIRTTDAKTHEKYAEEHSQLAAWLRELKERREQVSDDCISRQAVLDIAQKGVLVSNGNYESVCKAINEIPSAQPKTGHWISRPYIYGVAFCSKCGFELKINNTNYCPNCGRRMVEPPERSE